MQHKIDYESEGVYDIGGTLVDSGLRAAILDCIAAQKEHASGALAAFQPCPTADHEVSDARLNQIIEQDGHIHGIASERTISNVITFSARNIEDAVRDEIVLAKRREVDREISRLVRSLFRDERGLAVTSSGHLWYPPGSYMGWHTNSRVPGWRIYVNYTEQEGQSFFRYRNPDTGGIVTLNDREWNIRVFRITRNKPLWHAVRSDTNRFSMGYMVTRQSRYSRIKRRMRRFFGQ
jgi:hypothetical protein